MTKLFSRFFLLFALLLIALPLAAQIQGAWVNTGSMSTNREAGVQVTLGNGKALVAGGTDGTNILASAEIFDPSTGVWTLTGSLGTARQYSAGVVLKSGKVLVVGGVDATNNTLASAELYDPSTGKWSSTGTRNGGVTLKDNSPGSPQQTIAATGTGEPYAFAVSPSSITFPSELPGNSSPPVAVTVSNDANTPVTINNNISIAPNDGTFTQTNNCPATLQPGQSCTIHVVFTPPDSVTFTATLSVTDSLNQTQTVSLMGSGID
jgi:hypothetical protein